MKRYRLTLVLLAASCHVAPLGGARPTVTALRPADHYVRIGFDDLLQGTGSGIEPTAKLLAADGQRVRVVGFMAQMERPPSDGFYLTRRPLFCDEAGGGTGDLPPDAIRIQVLPARSTSIAFIPGPIEIIGILQLGKKEHPDGWVSHVHILLRDPETAAPGPGRTKTTSGKGERRS
jgi:hypothetical protein